MTARQLLVGTEIGGRYRIEAPISAGGMGAVYRATPLAGGAPVAVKHLLEERNALRLVIESRLLGRLRHPRVVRVLEHVVDASGHCLVMELVEGSSLHEIVTRDGPLAPARALQYTRQACEALAYVHGQQIVHRDVKPANLIVAERGVVLVDFGIAREAPAGTDRGTHAIGTPLYMAPEVLTGGVVSPRSDVFALAATVWTLLAGVPPPYLERVSLAALVPDLPPGVDRAVRAALEPDPYLRLASIDAFARALGEGLPADTGGASLAASVKRPSRPPALLETVAHSAAGVFDAAAASIALLDSASGELVYESSWGSGAEEIVGVRLAPGTGIAGGVLASGQPEAVARCADDPRFAHQIATRTGYVPNTMLVLPLLRRGRPFGVLQILDRRDGGPYGPADVARGEAFVALALAALDVESAGAATAVAAG